MNKMGAITTLTLENFRNHQHLTLNCEPITVICGGNGVGKTNILEAIRFLSLGKSFRAHRDKEVITFDKPATRIIATTTCSGETTHIVCALTHTKKQLTINGAQHPFSHIVGSIRTVLFALDDLDFINGPPHHRRQFLDQCIGQRSKVYVRALLDLRRILRRRNATLERMARGLAHNQECDVWDAQLCDVSRIVQEERSCLCKTLDTYIPSEYTDLTGGAHKLGIVYRPSEITRKLLTNTRGQDLRVRATSIGPHRDDCTITLDDRLLADFGSRGERRLAVLAIKKAEVRILTHDGDTPILLLDDVFSELDPARQDHLIQMFSHQQTIITSTVLPKKLTELTPHVIELV